MNPVKILKLGNQKICEEILRSLPDWFGIEESTRAYINKSKELPMVIIEVRGEIAGFLNLKHHSPFTSEVYVMGVKPEFHRRGLGKQLLEKAQEYLKENGFEFIQVKTVSEDRECEFYKKTRLFYKAQGFKEVEVFPTLWGKENPCLLLIKNL